MIDSKSRLILNILAQECDNGSYKIVEASDIVLSLPKHYRMDIEAVKHILTYLERQDMISIKYDDDNVYCLAVLPYGFEVLEDSKNYRTNTKRNINKLNILWCILSAFFGAGIALLISYFVLK